MTKYRYLLSILLAGLYLFPGVFSHAQAYTSVVVFGDSLSDAGNDTALSLAKYGPSAAVPSPATGYTQGSFTDGLDTSPAARNYTGVWVKQLAAMLPAHPAVVNSLAGGTDYAYGFGTTDIGTSEFDYGPGNVLSFTVNNMGQQVTDYLATNPTITNKTLFIVWGGANDLINATSSADIVAAAQRDAGIVQRLIAAGATDIIVPNLPPLGLVPRFNGSASTSLPPTEAAAGFNQALAAYLTGVMAAAPGVHIFQLDVYTIFDTIVGPPIAAGFANVTMSSQGNTAINPDTYLFWDDLHPTTYGHSILAAQAFTLIGTPVATTAAVTSNNIDANLNAGVTLTASVTSTKGTPIGYVTFLDGTTSLGTVLLSGSTATATATYNSSTLSAGTHNITAAYTGDNGYVSSTSSPISEVVTAPALSSALSDASVTVQSGSSVVTMLTLTPVGGYTGTVTLGCTVSTPHMSCAFDSSSVSLPGDNAQQSVILKIGTMSTATTAGLRLPPNPNDHNRANILAAFLLFPGLGFLGLTRLRKRLPGIRRIVPLLIFGVISSGALIGLTGCGSSANPNDTKPGTYTVQVTEIDGATVTTQTLTVIVTK